MWHHYTIETIVFSVNVVKTVNRIIISVTISDGDNTQRVHVAVLASSIKIYSFGKPYAAQAANERFAITFFALIKSATFFGLAHFY